MRKLLTAIVAALVLLPVSTGLTLAHDTSQFDQNYNDYCEYGESGPAGTDYSRGFDWVRASSSVGSKIKGARVKITARALWPCVHGGQINGRSYVSKSLLLASVQSDPNVGPINFAQAGIGKVHNINGQTQCSGVEAMVNDQTHFVYTPDPVGSPGIFCRATFVDLDNNGTADNPIGGRDYFVQVFEFDSGSSNYWRICFEDMTTLATDCKNTPRTSPDGGVSGNNAAWWGCEVGNSENAIGVPATLAVPMMFESQYKKATDNLWYFTENSSIATPWGSNPAYYKYGQSQTGTGESVWCFTASH